MTKVMTEKDSLDKLRKVTIGEVKVNKQAFQERLIFFSPGLIESATILDREKYKGIGRPRKTDYMTFIQAQRRLNQMLFESMEVPKSMFRR